MIDNLIKLLDEHGLHYEINSKEGEIFVYNSTGFQRSQPYDAKSHADMIKQFRRLVNSCLLSSQGKDDFESAMGIASELDYELVMDLKTGVIWSDDEQIGTATTANDLLNVVCNLGDEHEL